MTHIRLDATSMVHGLRRPFTISRGTATDCRLAHVRLTAPDGTTGWGDAAPSVAVSNEHLRDTLAALRAIDVKAIDPDDIGGTLDAVGPRFPAARAAFDNALHDLQGRLEGKPVHELLGLPMAALETTCTVSLDAPEAMAHEATLWLDEGARRLKLKLGHDGGIEPVEAVREVAPGVPLVVDANEAWDAARGPKLARRMVELGVDFIEQPVTRDDLAAMRAIQESVEIPVVADEAVNGPDDVIRLAEAEACRGVNVKVQKVGGIRDALRTIQAAKDHGMQVLIGCNEEAGIGISAGAVLAGVVDWLDLDGHMLLDADPFDAPWRPADLIGPIPRPGLGLDPTPAFLKAFEAGVKGRRAE